MARYREDDYASAGHRGVLAGMGRGFSTIGDSWASEVQMRRRFLAASAGLFVLLLAASGCAAEPKTPIRRVSVMRQGSAEAADTSTTNSTMRGTKQCNAIFNFQMGQLRVTMETDQSTRQRALEITESLAPPLKELFPELSGDIDIQMEYLRKYHAGTATSADASAAAEAGKGLNDYWAANCI
ncbi:MAG: hypothetical protein N2037_02560 [Acidimicrobiales bacterium]|nr:hypothetical protein [Acidimicrobiales bacterium]